MFVFSLKKIFHFDKGAALLKSQIHKIGLINYRNMIMVKENENALSAFKKDIYQYTTL